jgi:cobalamin biosynthesis Co2+ chelatase CbiK
MIHHGVKRNLKHVTVITCVAASGEHVISDMITSQESGDLREALRKKGIEFEGYVILKKCQKPYVKRTFIPHGIRIHLERGIEQEDAVLWI